MHVSNFYMQVSPVLAPSTRSNITVACCKLQFSKTALVKLQLRITIDIRVGRLVVIASNHEWLTNNILFQ